MSLLVLLHSIIELGGGLTPDSDGRLRFFRSRTTQKPLTDELRICIDQHRNALHILLEPTNLRRRWNIPSHVAMPPSLSTLLAYLQLEFSAFTVEERRAWLMCLTHRLDHYYADPLNADPRYICDLFAVEDVVRSRNGLSWQSRAPSVEPMPRTFVPEGLVA